MATVGLRGRTCVARMSATRVRSNGFFYENGLIWVKLKSHFITLPQLFHSCVLTQISWFLHLCLPLFECAPFFFFEIASLIFVGEKKARFYPALLSWTAELLFLNVLISVEYATHSFRAPSLGYCLQLALPCVWHTKQPDSFKSERRWSIFGIGGICVNCLLSFRHQTDAK